MGVARSTRTGAPVDTEEHLADLVLTADPEALADLRARVLAPLAELAPGTRDRLAETLLSWLLNQGRRDAVAAELHIHHAQTVRYRMGQVRELYGDRLSDPAVVRELVIALSGRSPRNPGVVRQPPFCRVSSGAVGRAHARAVHRLRPTGFGGDRTPSRRTRSWPSWACSPE